MDGKIEINKLVEEIIEDDTLSFEVVNRLQKIKEVSVTMEEQLRDNLNIINERDISIRDLMTDNNKLENRSSELIQREEAVANIEQKNIIAELKVTNSEHTLREIKDIIAMVFRNSTVRETVNKTVGHVTQDSNGYVTPQYTSDSENKTIEKN